MHEQRPAVLCNERMADIQLLLQVFDFHAGPARRNDERHSEPDAEASMLPWRASCETGPVLLRRAVKVRQHDNRGRPGTRSLRECGERQGLQNPPCRTPPDAMQTVGSVLIDGLLYELPGESKASGPDGRCLTERHGGSAVARDGSPAR